MPFQPDRRRLTKQTLLLLTINVLLAPPPVGGWCGPVRATPDNIESRDHLRI